MLIAFIQNLGLFEWFIIISLIMLFVRRSTLREAGRTVGRATAATPGPPAAAPLNSLQRHFDTLELPANASFAKVQETYRELVKVWHPDRFGNDEKLKERANAKLQEINAAYDALCRHFEAGSQRR